jgi:hypothetical protein
MSAGGDNWWDDYVEAIRQCVDSVQLPVDGSSRTYVDAQRYVIANFAQAYPLIMQRHPEHPDLLSQLSNVYPFAAANPDTTYLFASIGEGGLYRLSGDRKSVHYVDLQFGRDMAGFTEKPGPGTDSFDLDEFNIDDDGAFSILFGKSRPEGYAGDFREIHPDANYLMIRQVSYDWYREEDVRFAIERLDTPPVKPRDSDETKQAKLLHLSEYVNRCLTMFTGMVRHMLENSVVNGLQLGPYASIGGVTSQAYYEGIYDLSEDEALVLEAPMPDKARYWGIQLADEVFFSIDYMHRQSSLNGATAHVDSDGVIRVVLSASDPGIQNWLDITDYPRGIIMWRWTQCSDYPVPTVKKVRFDDLQKHLAADTPAFSAEDRREQMRRRLVGAQMRRRW